MKKIEKKSVIIFYPTQIENIKNYILNDISHEVFDPNYDIKFRYLFLSFLHFPKILFQILYIIKEVPIIKFLKILKLYLISKAIAININKLSPKTVLSYIDNSPIFHIVSKFCPNIPFIGMQNGNREFFAFTEELIHPSHKYHLDEYFCFGPKTKRIFLNYDQNNIKKYFYCGSFKEGIFFEKNYKAIMSRDKIHDICLLSEWMKEESDFHDTYSWQKHNSSIEQICILLSDYMKIKKINLAIALRSSNEDEVKFYKKYFKKNAIFYHKSVDGFSSYNAACSSRVVVALYSVLALEMIGAGVKVLYINPYGHENYKVSNSNCDWYLYKPDVDQFNKKINQLLRINRSKFFSDNLKEIAFMNSFNYTKPMHKLIRDSIIKKIQK